MNKKTLPGIIPVRFLFFVCACFVSGLTVVPVYASSEDDSLKRVSLNEVEVKSDYRHLLKRNSVLPVEFINKDFVREHFAGNIIQSLNRIPGVQSMDIGSGFSKPVIRGLGFNRITVIENGIKQEGQQWGADHGLEIDPFNVEQITIKKGPASLLYGSDAMGGAIVFDHFPMPLEDQFFGDVTCFGKSVNALFGISAQFGLKKNNWYTKMRFSEQHFGDYRVPTDTVVYLTQKMPIAAHRMKNTAGFERDVHFSVTYRKQPHQWSLHASNVYQKLGFFPGAHGIPDIERLKDDGNSRNIDLPYSWVNHFKLSFHQQYSLNAMLVNWDLGYQNNHREEWSQFHTHYNTQTIPEKDPDKELEFRLDTWHSGVKIDCYQGQKWEYILGWDIQYQKNKISGYSFLLPEYDRLMTGISGLTHYKANRALLFSAGIRYDIAHLDIAPFVDTYLEDYLRGKGYEEAQIEAYRIRSRKVNRQYGNYSFSLGMVWALNEAHILKVNMGRMFRLPGANELASNGVHHGTFRHEQGEASLDAEQGWQCDVAYHYETSNISLDISPFFSRYTNYIFLKPMGEWSILPHAGQIYRYSETRALFTGLEGNLNVKLPWHFSYQMTGEYVYTYNYREKTPIHFSPPFSMHHILHWKRGICKLSFDYHYIADQNRIARNEEATPGAHLYSVTVGIDLPLKNWPLELTLMAMNLADSKYYNHMSFYRKIEIPEPGRNFQILIKLPLKKQTGSHR